MQIFEALFAGRVPAAWLKAYPSLKPLGSWTRDLLARIEQLAAWVEGSYPTCYWLSGFTYPTGFLTAVLQTTARSTGVPIDALSFEHTIIPMDEADISGPPKEGVYIKGLFLEGEGRQGSVKANHRCHFVDSARFAFLVWSIHPLNHVVSRVIVMYLMHVASGCDAPCRCWVGLGGQQSV